MQNNIPDMLDVAFELEGSIVPCGYAFALWNEIVRVLPWLETEDMAGIIPLRGSESGDGLLLAKRSRLVLRLPAGLAEQATLLSGQELNIGSSMLKVGNAIKRPLQPCMTLHSHMVESTAGEASFLAEVAKQLDEMEISCEWICGRYTSRSTDGCSVSGYSLVLHDLKPDGSLRVQCAGLGGSRRFGCGIFVPYKTISRLD